MAQFRTTVDLIANVLRRCGEPTDGTSLFATQAIDYLNQIQNTVVTGGLEFNLEVDEPWIWARARRPLILELQPAYVTGSVTLTQGSVAGTFSAGPASSVEGWFLKLDSEPEMFRIGTHTAGATAFTLDGAFTPSSAVSQTFRVFKLDYEMASDYVIIDNENNKLDFSIDGSAELTATLTNGTYSPAALATAVAAALQLADAPRVYAGSYDAITRHFTITSNRASTAQFVIFGAGTNAYRSAWATIGFDYVSSTNAGSQVSGYALCPVVRLPEPGRVYFSSTWNYGQPLGLVEGIDARAMDELYPLGATSQGVPSAFCYVREKNDGRQVVRVNKYPDRKVRIEFEYIPVPFDLQNTAASIPAIPRKFVRLLEFGAAYYILTDKRDSKAEKYFALAQQTLQGMMKVNRKELQRIGLNFGNIIARPDLMPDKRVRINNYGYDAGNT